jgi:hypothetical protein
MLRKRVSGSWETSVSKEKGTLREIVRPIRIAAGVAGR